MKMKTRSIYTAYCKILHQTIIPHLSYSRYSFTTTTPSNIFMKKSCSLHFLPILLCFLSYYYKIGLVLGETSITTDQSSLLVFKSQTTLKLNWSDSVSVCNWVGVSCSGPHGRVTALDLSNMGLGGSISPYLGNLSFLDSLNLSGNSFHDHLPNELANLRRLKFIDLNKNYLSGGNLSWVSKLPELRYLNLSNNKFAGMNVIPEVISNVSSLQWLDLSFNNLSGVLPHDTCTFLQNLEWVSFSKNNLYGQLPLSLDRCSKLQVLRLANNRFTGMIPGNIGNLTKLKEVNLQYNNLQGEIPNSFGKLNNLVTLAIAFNNLTGSIPSTIFNISTIEVILMSSNHLTGRLPYSTDLQCRKLKRFTLWANSLSGKIPESIGNFSSLNFLELGTNFFSGLIPNTFGNLRFLRTLHLGSNYLTTTSPSHKWSFFTSLENCREIVDISLQENPLNGILPTSIGNLSSSIQYFYAYGCGIKGRIPLEVGNLSNLMVLSLFDNDLSGSIPRSIGRLQKLQGLGLSSNNLEGFIPQEICYLKKLYLYLSGENKLHGQLPSCFSNLTSLNYLGLTSNNLSSKIPLTFWSLTNMLSIDLSFNSLSGTLPSEVGNLKNLIYFEVSNNQLSGILPSSIGGLQNLQNLSLAYNGFQGSIPQSFGNLISLIVLDLSHNMLSGVIPKPMEALASLKQFNVSSNRLAGEIPTEGPFKNFTAQSYLENNALCGSPLLQVLPCENHTSQQPNTLSIVLKCIFLVSASIILVTALVIIIFKRRRKRKVKLASQDSLHLAEWRRVTHGELQRATNGFDESNLIGLGGFGAVYKGSLSDGIDVAVKVFNLEIEGACESFEVECEVISQIRHRNLVKIITSCCVPDFKALVLEFVPNGNLEKWLYSHNLFLDILKRLDIMIDVASALAYLHHGQVTPVVHCDLKPNNILLDEDMVAHVADFGISKLLGETENLRHTITCATVGYMAPEYGSTGIISTKSDVYSFGILIMETFTRRKPTDEIFVGDRSLKDWVKDFVPHGLTEVVDANLLREGQQSSKLNCVSSVLRLALDCCVDLPTERGHMKDVLITMESIRRKLKKELYARN